jgi:hypothetical protein
MDDAKLEPDFPHRELGEENCVWEKSVAASLEDYGDFNRLCLFLLA